MARAMLKSVYYGTTDEGGFGLIMSPPVDSVRQYPKAKYHPTKDPRVVKNEAEEAKLSKEWSDTPIRKQDARTIVHEED